MLQVITFDVSHLLMSYISGTFYIALSSIKGIFPYCAAVLTLILWYDRSPSLIHFPSDQCRKMHLGPGSGLLQGTATALWMSPLPSNWTGKANTKGESAELLYQSRLYSLTTIDFSRTVVIYFLLPFPSHPHPTCTTTKQASRTCYLSESPVQDLAISSTLLLSCWAQTTTWILLTKLNSSVQNNRARRNSSNLPPQQTN